MKFQIPFVLFAICATLAYTKPISDEDASTEENREAEHEIVRVKKSADSNESKNSKESSESSEEKTSTIAPEHDHEHEHDEAPKPEENNENAGEEQPRAGRNAENIPEPLENEEHNDDTPSTINPKSSSESEEHEGHTTETPEHELH